MIAYKIGRSAKIKTTIQLFIIGIKSIFKIVKYNRAFTKKLAINIDSNFFRENFFISHLIYIISYLIVH